MTDQNKSRASTHSDWCWSWGPKHYECALREIKALQEVLTALKAENEMLRKVLKEADDELDWLDKGIDTCDYLAGVCMRSYWIMRGNMKAALSKGNGNKE